MNLDDPGLLIAANTLDDIEKLRIGTENRLRQMIRKEVDSDDTMRGLGLDINHLDVKAMALTLTTFLHDSSLFVELEITPATKIRGEVCCLEHGAIKTLERKMKRHPLGPWMQAQKGVGLKQGARLLAAIGDPYWNDLHGRPRLVSELWSYSGYSVIDGLAPRRRKGVQGNWSEEARMRARLVSESCIKQTTGAYRKVYDDARLKYDGAIHKIDCIRCGPSGNPAKAGSPLSLGHQHARALRCVSKEILKDMWKEAKRIHEEA